MKKYRTFSDRIDLQISQNSKEHTFMNTHVPLGLSYLELMCLALAYFAVKGLESQEKLRL